MYTTHSSLAGFSVALDRLVASTSIPSISYYSLSGSCKTSSDHTPENTTRSRLEKSDDAFHLPQLPSLNSSSIGRMQIEKQVEWPPASGPPQWEDTPYFVVGHNVRHLPGISFFPHDGIGSGVAMGLAFYQEGMIMRDTSIENHLPCHLRRVKSLPLVFWWPGYTHIKVKRNIDIKDPLDGKHVTYGRLAQQVAQAFASFIEVFADKFDGTATGVQLGPRAVTFHNLRLLQIYVQDDRALRAELAYTRRR
ncbi:hypothetical protein FB45DRAFT_97179 [Roridomyces roridus]|uniref:Uncharacterized protein n=1 Tax=Roridomyces roridus TaxID=1738132 RepID=A0AAD7BK03_9AGAR|nr:hypothetical protein FB45DRAFT_97179 [Roridomyces roridus]